MLPLFPLNLVIFPESAVPLHIFEERYRNLINDCIESQSDFGINLVLSGKIQKIGCSARVVDIVKRYPNGQMDIIVRGIKKYKLIDSKLSERLYLLGEVEYIEEEIEYPDINLLEQCIELYNKIAEEVSSLRLQKVDSSMFYSLIPSYFFAQKVGLSKQQKYDLLKLENESERLSFLLGHLKEVEPMLHESEIIKKLIQGDGYAKQFR